MKKILANAVLRLCGWQVKGVAPEIDQCVVIAAPHTSNWDFIWMKLMAWTLDWQINWLGKHTLFTGIGGGVMLWWGGVPIDRRSKQDTVSQVVERFDRGDKLMLMIPAEGTRSYSENWRSGFYHIARGAGVPVVLSFLDFKTRTGGIGPAIYMSDDMTADMNQIRSFYSGMEGKFPELSGPMYLSEEQGKEQSNEQESES